MFRGKNMCTEKKLTSDELEKLREKRLSEYTGWSIRKIRKVKANEDKLILDIDIINHVKAQRQEKAQKAEEKIALRITKKLLKSGMTVEKAAEYTGLEIIKLKSSKK
jgi:hypothetical protein